MDAPSLHGRWRTARLVSHDRLAERATVPPPASGDRDVLRCVRSRPLVSASDSRAAHGTTCPARACEPPARGALVTVTKAMQGIELANHLRLLSGYHFGLDIIDRLSAAERFQRQQREALAMAADRIEELEAEVARTRATAPKPAP